VERGQLILVLFGGHHQDPLHRLRLRADMTSIHSKRGDPEFVAVEANQSIFHAVISPWQRQHFVELAQKDPKLSMLRLDELECLAKTIHYEADSHHGLFAKNPRVIWLDDGRSFSSADDPCGTAVRYLKTCREALRKENPGRSVRRVREAISKFVAARAAGHAVNDSFDRDKVWIKKIPREKFSKPRYGIVVVGESHVQDGLPNLRALLRGKGYRCEVRFLANGRSISNS
jgi:hypothetical protein